MDATNFVLVPVAKNKDKKELEIFLRANKYLYCLPTALSGVVLSEYNKGDKHLGKILEERMNNERIKELEAMLESRTKEVDAWIKRFDEASHKHTKAKAHIQREAIETMLENVHGWRQATGYEKVWVIKEQDVKEYAKQLTKESE